MKQFICTMILVLVATVVNAQSDDAPRYEVGAFFSSATIKEPDAFDLPNSDSFRTEPGFGGRFTYNITNSIAAEGELVFFPNDDRIRSYNPYTAGRATQGTFGVKAGRRFEKFGIYGKVRPGFAHFSRALSGSRRITTPTGDAFLEVSDGRTNLVIDVGGVLEFYPSRRIVTRFDLGNTILRFNELTYPFQLPPLAGPTTPPSSTATLPATTTNNFQFSAGVSVRF